MIGYKMFNKDWICRGMQYQVGCEYTIAERPVICQTGFHFCTRLEQCFNYYHLNDTNKIAKVEALGEIDVDVFWPFTGKCCTNRIKILREIPRSEVPDIIGLKTVDLDVKQITILSKDEIGNDELIYSCVYQDLWWLRDGYCTTSQPGIISCRYDTICDVRPALKCNLGSTNLRIGNHFWFADHRWTMINEDTVLCDDILTKMVFRKDWEAPDASDYEKSDIKKWLDDWADKHQIIKKER